MSRRCRNFPPGRRVATRVAARQVRRRHQITVIHATGPGAPTVLMVRTPGDGGRQQEQGSPGRASRVRSHRSWERHLLVTVIGCARGTCHQGERRSPEPGDWRSGFPDARRLAAATPARAGNGGENGCMHITRTRSPSLTLTAVMALTSPAPRSERQPRKPAPGTNRLSRGTHKAHRRTDDRVVGWDDRLHQHRW